MKILLSLLLIIPSLSWSNQQEIYLVCEQNRSLDLSTGEYSPLSPETSSLKITLFNNEFNFSTIESNKVFCMTLGYFDETEIWGECKKDMSNGIVVQKLLKVNRYSGEYSEKTTFEGKQGGLVFYGTCKTANKKF